MHVPMVVGNSTNFGSCVKKASVDRLSVDSVGRYIGRSSVEREDRVSVDTLSTLALDIGRHSVDMSVEHRLKLASIDRHSFGR